MLRIENLHARAGEAEILKGIDLVVNTGEIHAVMGPNGSGKSTLANVLAGRPEVEISSGRVRFEGRDLLELSPEDRAREGIFLAFQYPVEIPGVTNSYFMKAALNAIRKHRGEPELDAMDFLSVVRENALRIVAEGVNALRGPDRAMVVITHYQRLLDYIVPDFVHVLAEGRIARSGGKELALELEREGYGWLEKEPESAGVSP
jgi:Fe-S cluster assembly ATP-binding protein